MIVFIDKDYKCHTSNPDNEYRAFDLPFADGKCQTFIEGYRFVSFGESWTRSDGVVFQGEMIAPWKDYNELDAAQREHERQLLAEANTKLEQLTSSYQEGINSI